MAPDAAQSFNCLDETDLGSSSLVKPSILKDTSGYLRLRIAAAL